MRPTDLELLGIQGEAALAGRYGVTIACSAEGQALWIGGAVPHAIAEELAAIVERAPGVARPEQPPAALDECARILAPGVIQVGDGPALARAAGPSYLIEDDVAFASAVRIERSDAADLAALRGANPGNWQPVEWDELLDGSLGPWTLALDGERVVSLCHTPGPLAPRAAECGVWTDPAFRGRGYAAAVAAAWAALVRPTGRWLFYSTDASNRSSQRVAERLHLRPLGWTWRLDRTHPHDDHEIHPLSSLRRRR